MSADAKPIYMLIKCSMLTLIRLQINLILIFRMSFQITAFGFFNAFVGTNMAYSSYFLAYTLLGFVLLINQIEISLAVLSNLKSNGPPAIPNFSSTKMPSSIAEQVYAVNLPNAKQTVLLNSKGEVVARIPSHMYGNKAKSTVTPNIDFNFPFDMPQTQPLKDSKPANEPPIPSNPYLGVPPPAAIPSPGSQSSIPGTTDMFASKPAINNEIMQLGPKLLTETLKIIKSKPSPAALEKLQNILNIASKSGPSSGALKALQTALSFASKTVGMSNVGPLNHLSAAADGSNTAGYAQNSKMFNEFPAKENQIPAKGALAGLSGSNVAGTTGNRATSNTDPFGWQNAFASMPMSGNQQDLFGSTWNPTSNAGVQAHSHAKKTPGTEPGIQIKHQHIHGVDMNTLLFGLLNKGKAGTGITGTNVGPLGDTQGGPELFVVSGEHSLQTPQFKSFMSKLTQALKSGPSGTMGMTQGAGQGLMSPKSSTKSSKSGPGVPPKGAKKVAKPASTVDPGEVGEAAAEAAAEAAEAAEAARSSAEPAPAKGKSTKAGKAGSKPSAKAAGKPAADASQPVEGTAAGNNQQTQGVNEAHMSNAAGQNPVDANPTLNQQQYPGNQMPYSGGQNYHAISKGTGQQSQTVEGTYGQYTGGQNPAVGNEHLYHNQATSQMSYTGAQNSPYPNAGGQMFQNQQIPYQNQQMPYQNQQIPFQNQQIQYPGSSSAAQAPPRRGKIDQTVAAEASGREAAIAAAEAAENIEAGRQAGSKTKPIKSKGNAMQGSSAYQSAGGTQAAYVPPADFGAPSNFAAQASWSGQSQVQDPM